MPLLRNLSSYAAVTATAVVLAHPLSAADNESELKRIAKATETLNALVQTPDDRIPEHILQRAEAIVVIPNLIKGGFIIGAENGKGIMSIRDAKSGGWSAPSFVQMTGGSIGWQIGVQSTDVVLVFKNRASLDRIIQGKNKLTLGADAAVAAGPLGRQAEAGTDHAGDLCVIAREQVDADAACKQVLHQLGCATT